MKPNQTTGERGGSLVERRTPEGRGWIPNAAVLCPWARHFTPRKYWLITQEAVATSRHDWKIVDWDVKPQHKQNQPNNNQNEPQVPIPASHPPSTELLWSKTLIGNLIMLKFKYMKKEIG